MGGSVALSVKPYVGAIVGHAFTTCASAEYRLGGIPLDAFVLVDAARPTSFAALLPGFHAIEHGKRLFADGGLTARRYRGGWIVARQGRNVEQRVALLEGLTATTPSLLTRGSHCRRGVPPARQSVQAASISSGKAVIQ